MALRNATDGSLWSGNAAHCLLILIIFSPLYLAGVTDSIGTNGDNAEYILLAKGLVETGSYVSAKTPEYLPHTKFPPLLPSVLALTMHIFGESVVAMKVAICIFAIFSLLALFFLLNMHLGGTPAFIIVLLVGANPIYGEYVGQIMSEVPFMFFLFLGLYCLEHYRREDAALSRFAFFTAICLALVVYTRTIGIAVFASSVGYLFLEGIISQDFKRGSRKAVVLFLLVCILVAPWFIRKSLIAGEEVSYVTQLFLKTKGEIAEGSIGIGEILIRIPKGAAQYRYYLTELLFGSQSKHLPFPEYTILLSCSLFLIGLIYCIAYKRSAIEYAVVAYLAICVIWPGKGTRFILPLLPFLLGYCYQTLGLLGRVLGRAGPALGIALACLLFSYHCYLSIDRNVVAKRSASYYRDLDPAWGEFYEMSMWIRSNLGENSYVLSRKASLQAFWSKGFGYTYPQIFDTAKAMEIMQQNEATHVIVDSFRWWAQTEKYLIPVMKSYPDKFELVKAIGNTKLYRIVREPKATI